MATKFFLCTTCGNVVVKVVDSGVVPVCCGDEMQELVPASTDGALERHVPVVECRDDCTIVVKIGSLPHPMAEEHHIVFIYVETANGGQIQYLKPKETPQAVFCVCEDKPLAVYAYCNIHGLWKTDVKSCLNTGQKSCQNTDPKSCQNTDSKSCRDTDSKSCQNTDPKSFM